MRSKASGLHDRALEGAGVIFGKDLAKLVARGKKTQTRRPLQRAPRSPWIVSRDGSRRRRPTAKVIQLDGQLYRACRYEVGHSYSVQPGRGKEGIARITITDRRRERVGDIDFASARAEGFRTTDEFRLAWVRIHDAEWIKREELDRYADQLDQFGDGDASAHGVTDWILLERFDRRHADTLVWVLTFVVQDDVPRLLAPASSGAGDADESGERHAVPPGYTVQPGRGLSERRAEATRPPSLGGVAEPDAQGRQLTVPEPEPVDDATLARFAADAVARRAGAPGQREEDLHARARSLARRLRQEADADAKSNLDVIGELEQIEQQLRQLKRGRDAA